MSHKLKCGCVVSDSNDTAVKKGFILGGATEKRCEEHMPAKKTSGEPQYETGTAQEVLKAACEIAIRARDNDIFYGRGQASVAHHQAQIRDFRRMGGLDNE